MQHIHWNTGADAVFGLSMVRPSSVLPVLSLIPTHAGWRHCLSVCRPVPSALWKTCSPVVVGRRYECMRSFILVDNLSNPC